jgi:D-alanyl-D-alanine carboxypeptidase
MSDKNIEEKKTKKHPFTLTKLILTLLAIAIAFLGVAAYANLHRDEIGKKLAEEQRASAGAAATSSASASTLPKELTTLGSDQYLVNKQHKLPDGYAPTDAELSTPYLNSTTDAIRLKTSAADAAKSMKAAATSAGVTLIVSAGYLTYQEQQDLYTSTLKLLNGEEGAAATAIEKAGYSEHQLGLAIDFTSDASQAKPTVAFADTDASKWLAEHAHEYGFILRYPKGKESITGYDFMPWHYRYVGVDVATAIYNANAAHDETFEEYYNITK